VIERHYDQAREDERLAGAWGQLDLARTQEILRRHLPPPPAAVLDIGGGPGVYSRWLAGEGYEAHLIDLVPKHVEQARAGGGIASASVGDARSVARPGFSLLELVGVEGPAWLAGNFEQRWADPMSRERLLEAARCVENDVNLMVVSLHLLAAATVAPASAGEVAS